MAIQRELGFQAQGIARAQPTRSNAEFFASFQNFVPDHRTGGLIRRDVDLESIFTGIPGARDESILQSAHSAARDPIELDRGEVSVRQLLE